MIKKLALLAIIGTNIIYASSEQEYYSQIANTICASLTPKNSMEDNKNTLETLVIQEYATTDLEKLLDPLKSKLNIGEFSADDAQELASHVLYIQGKFEESNKLADQILEKAKTKDFNTTYLISLKPQPASLSNLRFFHFALKQTLEQHSNWGYIGSDILQQQEQDRMPLIQTISVIGSQLKEKTLQKTNFDFYQKLATKFNKESAQAAGWNFIEKPLTNTVE